VFDLENSSEFKGTHIADNFRTGDVTDTVVERWSMPTRFGQRYRQEILATPNLDLLQGYEARTFSDPDKNGVVRTLTLRNIDSGATTEINAKSFVLAAGTQESTRILLRNNNLFANIGGAPDSLGKYYQGHISGKIASVKFYGDKKNTQFGFLRDQDGIYLRRRFQFTTDFLVKNNLLNTAIWLDNPLYHNPVHRSGPMSFMYMAMITPVLGKKLAPPAIAHSITKGKKENIGAHLVNIAKDLPGSLVTPATIFYKRYLLKRKLPGIFLYSPKNKYALHYHAEQVPAECNTMSLAPDGETLLIKYSLVEEDATSIIALHKKLDADLRANNCGELEYWYPEHELKEQVVKNSKDGLHQSGTTRIAKDASQGVVDYDLKVFGTDNVYVCSSSVFPTSGQANPTFYLGAFAVRLANFLSK
jgi:choline dehydrogenase-like flavoprotein